MSNRQSWWRSWLLLHIQKPSMSEGNKHAFSIGQGGTSWQWRMGFPGAPGTCRNKGFLRSIIKPVECGAVSPCWAPAVYFSIYGYFNRNMFIHFMWFSKGLVAPKSKRTSVYAQKVTLRYMVYSGFRLMMNLTLLYFVPSLAEDLKNMQPKECWEKSFF